MGYTVNQRVAIYRKMANLTQTEAAERLGMKCSTYSQMERKGNISVEKLFSIAKAFGIDPEVLLHDPMEPPKRESTPPAKLPRPTERINTVLREPVLTPDLQPPFLITKNEENLLTVLRNLPKSDYDDVRNYINEKYRNAKTKKQDE